MGKVSKMEHKLQDKALVRDGLQLIAQTGWAVGRMVKIQTEDAKTASGLYVPTGETDPKGRPMLGKEEMAQRKRDMVRISVVDPGRGFYEADGSWHDSPLRKGDRVYLPPGKGYAPGHELTIGSDLCLFAIADVAAVQRATSK